MRGDRTRGRWGLLLRTYPYCLIVQRTYREVHMYSLKLRFRSAQPDEKDYDAVAPAA